MTIRTLIIGLISFVFFNSCTEYFVDVEPLSFVTVENYYKNPEEVEIAPPEF